MSSALELVEVSRNFGPVAALREASLAVRPGTVHALLGENGAGKSTLMRIAFGMLAPDRGRIRINGREVTPRSPVEALTLGVGMVHQHFTLVPEMTVAENVALGGTGRLRLDAAVRRVEALASATGLAVDAHARVADLPVGAQQRVEILKALARDVRVLILDEPTAVLSPPEVEELLRWIRTFATGDRAAILITHKLREALAVADDVTVLRGGRTVLARPTLGVAEAELVAAMIGESVTRPGERPAPPTPGEPVARLQDATVQGPRGYALRGASFEVRRGELVGIAAVEGAGHAELLRLLTGLLAPTTGSAVVPRDVAFIPEDRHRDAVVLEQSLVENLALRGLSQRTGRLPWGELAERSRELVAAFDVRTPAIDVPIRTLSGGNQQKFVLARELEGRPALVVAENPTRGLDVKATHAVLEALRRARDDGAGVVVYSSDVDEVLAIADRVVVVHAGRLLDVPCNRDAVGRAMLGAPA